MKRLGTAVVLALFAIYSIFFAPPWLFMGIVALMACLCYFEYAGIALAAGIRGPLWSGYPLGLIAIARPDTLPVLVLILFALALANENLRDSLGYVATTALALVYIFLGWRWAAGLRDWSPWWLFYALSINWVGDAAAFYVGRSFGRHKLAPKVSPGKSWEGAAGSMIATILYGVVFGRQALPGTEPVMLAILSAVANVAGQVGDLAESALKRGAGVKDSGTLLPGHGGFLDRLDSTLFTLPVVYHFLLWTSTTGFRLVTSR